jgi:hypothetical protein
MLYVTIWFIPKTAVESLHSGEQVIKFGPKDQLSR